MIDERAPHDPAGAPIGSGRDGAPELARLASAVNFRDVAGRGAGYPVRGGRMRRDVVYRSSQLILDDADVATLVGLGVAAVHDLRNDHETARHPDTDLPGATHHHRPVVGVTPDNLARFGTADETYQGMLAAYRAYVADAANRASFGGLLRAVALADRPQLLHCTAGKDRTGWATALLHRVAGASDETIMSDYLLTAEYVGGAAAEARRRLAERVGPDLVHAYLPAMEVRPEYLRSALDEATALFGGVDGYLTDGLGLRRDELDQLHARLVEADPDGGRPA